MSKRTQSKDIPSEDSSDSSVSVRRSSRIQSSQTAVSSPIPRGITTRRGSASSNSEKIVNGDADRASPIIDRRKTRRTSTDLETNNPTPIKTRRSSISKLVEEEKKPISSPGTPSRKNTRSVSISPSNISDGPARRTRKSSQDSETTEQLPPPRRSTRRRPSADTQEENAKEEAEEIAKPVTRRRRSSSLDEVEPVKKDTKPKTKRIFSEDNLLEPIAEKETESKLDQEEENIRENKTVHDLSVIEEIEDAEMDESERIVKDIDAVLQNNTPKPKPDVSSKSIFSPITPKTLEKSPASEKKSKNSSIREEKVESNQDENIEKDENKTKKRDSLEKKVTTTVEQNNEIASKETSEIPIKESTDGEKTTSEGSDESFTLKLSESINKSKSAVVEDEDEVFSSPGSNKENSSVNVPSKNASITQRESLNKSKESIVTSTTKSRNSFYEAMEVDDEEEVLVVTNTSREEKNISSTKDAELEQNSSKPDVELSNSPILNKSKNISITKVTNDDSTSDSPFVINSSISDKDYSSANSEKEESNDTKNVSSTPYKETEDDDDSDISIKLVDSDEEKVEEKGTSPQVIENVKRSKRPRMSDGTSKNILMRLQQDVEKETENISEDRDVIDVDSSSVDSSDREEGNNEEVEEDKKSSVQQDKNEKNESHRDKTFELNNESSGKEDLNADSDQIELVINENSEEEYESPKSQEKEEEEEIENLDSEAPKTNDRSMNESSNDTKNTISPLKSKLEKMKACGVNFANSSPARPKIRLNEAEDAKLNELINSKINQLVDDDSSSENESSKKQEKSPSEDGSMSDDFERNEFVDDMAEEGEEDSPSDDSNAIPDRGESINSSDSENDSDDEYDLNDSFIVDDDETELLPGDEYDLESDDVKEKKKEKTLKRRRIVEAEDLSSEDEVAEKVKSPAKRISLEKSVKSPKESLVVNENLEESVNKIPSIIVSSPAKTSTPSVAFGERIRSLVTPNTSLNESVKSPKQCSGRSSSIIIHENISVNEIQSSMITDKLQQVVKVFCAGLRTSEGNISMNVSLDYIENPSKTETPDEVVVLEDAKTNESDEQKRVNISSNEQVEKRKSLNVSQKDSSIIDNDFDKRKMEAVSPIKKRRSSHKLEQLNESQKNLSKIEDSDVSQRSEFNESLKSKKKRRSSNKFDIQSKAAEDTKNPSFRIELNVQEEIENSVSPLKKRRSSNKFEKQLNASNDNISKSPLKVPNESNQESSKKRSSSDKFDKQLNVSKDQSSSSPFKVKHTEVASSKVEKKISNSYEEVFKNQQIQDNENSTETEAEETQVKKRKNRRNRKKNKLESIVNQELINKRAKLIEMACEGIYDIASKLPSQSENTTKSDRKADKMRLKRLQSKLKFDTKFALLGNLITDVKNRPKRSLKPSSPGPNPDWNIEEANIKPSVSNENTSNFDYKKISAKDFKNQMIYDPRIKREPTSKLLRNKGYYV